MTGIVRAEGPMLERIMDQTFPLWNDGLTRERYRQYNRAQVATRWGASHLERVALADGDRILSSAKRYDLVLRLDGRAVKALGIGAVFTPPEQRGRGHAAELIRQLSAQAHADGAAIAMLFSEIGPRYYRGLGFDVVPVREVDLDVRRQPGAPAMLVRAVDDRDYPLLGDMQTQLASRFRLALDGNGDWLHYSVAKKRMLAALVGPGRRQVECFVAEEGGQAAAWVLLQITGRERAGYLESWSVEACGDRDPGGARIGAILQTLLARTPTSAPHVIRAWWPSGLEPPQVAFTERPAPAITMMMKVLDGSAPPVLRRADVLYWHGDAF